MISLWSLSAPCTALTHTALGLLPLLSSRLLINGLSCMFLDRDAHVANYTAKVVTAATTNTSKYSTVTTAGPCQEGTHHAHDPSRSSLLPALQPETLSISLYTSFFPFFSKTEAHMEVNTLEGGEAICVSALHTPAGSAKHRVGAWLKAPPSTQFSQFSPITGALVLNNFVVPHCEN